MIRIAFPHSRSSGCGAGRHLYSEPFLLTSGPPNSLSSRRRNRPVPAVEALAASLPHTRGVPPVTLHIQGAQSQLDLPGISILDSRALYSIPQPPSLDPCELQSASWVCDTEVDDMEPQIGAAPERERLPASCTALTLPYGRGSDWSTAYARILSIGRHLRRSSTSVSHTQSLAQGSLALNFV